MAARGKGMGMTNEMSARGASTLWILLLTAVSTITTLVLACATPFPALAALAAVHMHRRDGVLLMLAAWAVSQGIGFGMLHYPHDATTLGWAVALGTAAIVSALAASSIAGRLSSAFPVRLALAYVAGFVAFKAIVFLWSLGLGGAATALSPSIMANQFLRNGAILIGLLILYRALVALGVPAAPSVRTAAA